MTHSLPLPIGPLSHQVIAALLATNAPSPTPRYAFGDDPLDHDLQLALYVLNELHYAGWASVPDALEWHSDVTSLRTALNQEFERRLREAIPTTMVDPQDEVRKLLALDGPSVSQYLLDHGTIEQVRESMILRSPYQSKEADPHTFALPRFTGPTKRVFCEIQSGEYGVGHRRSHAELFADALTGLNLDPTPNAHIDACSGASLAISNLVTLGALHRRLRGIVLGQLALFEMDSVVPNKAMADCCDRLNLPTSVRPFFQIHVLADTEHEVMVERTFLGTYPKAEPDQVQNVLLGMRAQSLIDQALAGVVVPAWQAGHSALNPGAQTRNRLSA